MWEITLVVVLIVGLIIFAITCFFVIRVLIALQRTALSLRGKLENLSEEATTALRLTEARLMLFDSTFRSLSNVGDICESKTAEWKAAALTHHHHRPIREDNLREDMIRFALSGVNIYQQLFKKKG